MTVRYDPTMMVPVHNLNPGIRNYQNFSASFFIVIQDRQKEPEDHLTLDYDELQSNEGVALQSTNSSKRLHALLDDKRLIKK